MNSNGLPSLNNKFKDLNLQLHASATVTNPYTFNIQGNCSFNASIEADVATYQIKCGISDYGNYQIFMIRAIGYSSIGYVKNPKNFGALNNTNFKGATIYSVFFSRATRNPDRVVNQPSWEIFLSKDVGDAITLETSNIKVIIPKYGTKDNHILYALYNTNAAPQWSENNTYELKLYL